MKGSKLRLMKCPKCGAYTMKNECQGCGVPCIRPSLAYSPDDKHGKHRRRLMYEGSQDNKNGKSQAE